MQRVTTQGVVLSNANGEILLTLAGDAVHNGQVMDMLEGLDTWETMGGSFDDWQSALIAVDANR